MPKYIPHYLPGSWPWRASTETVSIPYKTEEDARDACLHWQALGYHSWTTFQGDFRPGMQVFPVHEDFPPKPKEG